MLPRLTAIYSIKDEQSEILCVRFSPDLRYLAAGYNDGGVKIFDTKSGYLSFVLKEGSASSFPILSLRFRPCSYPINKTKYVLLIGRADGIVQHYHLGSRKCLDSLRPETGAEIFTLDYSYDGTQFSCAGNFSTVYVYDESTRQKVTSFEGTSRYRCNSNMGHSSRIYAVKYVPNDANVIASGGWDKFVYFWDTRTRAPVKKIYGPYIGGECLDVCDGNVLTGSCRAEDQLQLWDYGTGKLLHVNLWQNRKGTTHLYTAQFSNRSGATYIAAGGSGCSEARIFDMSKKVPHIGTVLGSLRGVFSLDFGAASSADNPQDIAVAGSDSIRMVSLNPKVR